MDRLTGPESKYERDLLAQDLGNKIEQFVKLRLLPSPLGVAIADGPRSTAPRSCMDSARQSLGKAQAVIEGLSHFSSNVDNFARMLVDYVNVLYTEAYRMHEFCVFESDVDIPYPRLNLTEMQAEEGDQEETLAFMDEWTGPIDDENADSLGPEHILENEEEVFQSGMAVARFQLPLQNVLGTIRDGHNLITGLETRREQRFQKLLSEGHAAMLAKHVDQGLAKFEEALRLKETAEILTLVAWAYSLKEKNDLAKSYCLKAIQKDPDYGPPYNDLGAILLKEGQVEEGLKWFELAKRSPNYHNREYPYINCGRAYLCQKKYGQALEEFSKALSLAPYHKELHQTVSKLKKTLERAATPVSGSGRPNDGAHP